MKIKELYQVVYGRGTDGVDHILVSPFGETLLGKFCSLQWRSKFFIPNLGEFAGPTNFAGWVVTGDENLRHSKSLGGVKVPREVWRNARLYAKFAQLTALKNVLLKKYNSIEELEREVNLPFLTYKVHAIGVKERLADETYNSTIKEMVVYILNSEGKPDWNQKFDDFSLPEAKALIMDQIKNWSGGVTQEKTE